MASSGGGPSDAGGGGGTDGGTGTGSGNKREEGGERDSSTPLVASLVVVFIVLVALGVFWYRRNNTGATASKTIAHSVKAPPPSLQYGLSGGASTFGASPGAGIELGATGVVNPLSTFNNGSGANRAASVQGRNGRVMGQRQAMPHP